MMHVNHYVATILMKSVRVVAVHTICNKYGLCVDATVVLAWYVPTVL